jgi:predicted ATPase
MYGLVQACIARMVEAVQHYEGHVAHFTGDGVMAVFGAPVAHEESERRAVAAALRMQEALQSYSSEVRRSQGVECRFRVGLHSGPVVVGKVSDRLDLDFTAIGDTVNLAARMQQMAEPGSVYLTESTYRPVAGYFDCESLGALAVKGKVEPVSAYRALRERPARTRFEVSTERGLAPFVGREEELAALERYFDRVRQGRGQAVFVSGEAGIGKSRLLLEFRRRVGTEARWLAGRCSSYGRAVPYLPVIELIKQAFSVEEGDHETGVIGRVEKATSDWEEAARATVPYLRSLLSVDPGDPHIAEMDPRERRAGILDALRALVLKESARSPLVLVVEDVQWVDELSEKAMAALVDLVPSTPVFLVLTHRPGSAQALERTYSTRLSLEPLAEEESAAFVRGVLGAATVPPELDRLVSEKAEGNPFYTEEVVRSLLETGVLTEADGHKALTRSLREVRIPDTIQEVILSRIDRLDRHARDALQLASVIGREFTFRLLQRISHPQSRFEDALAELKAVELVYEKAYFPELVYLFKHALTHDVAYSTLLTERRRAVHRLVGAAIEELYADRLVEHYETLAHHYAESQEWNKALEYLIKAGDKAAAACANQDALGYYARALEVLAREDLRSALAGQDGGAERSRLLARMAMLASGSENLDRAAELAELAIEEAGGHSEARAQALLVGAIVDMNAHRRTRSQARFDEALALFEQVGNARGIADILDGQAMASLLDGSLHEAAEAFDRVARLFMDSGDLLRVITPRASRGLTLVWMARPGEALDDTGEALDLARTLGHPEGEAYALWCRSEALAALGQTAEAAESAQGALAIAQRLGHWEWTAAAYRGLGIARQAAGDHDAAEAAFRSSLDVAEEHRLPHFESFAAARLASTLIGRGNVAEAEALVARALATGLPLSQYEARLAHAHLAAARGDPDRQTIVAHALEIAEAGDHVVSAAALKQLLVSFA